MQYFVLVPRNYSFNTPAIIKLSTEYKKELVDLFQ